MSDNNRPSNLKSLPKSAQPENIGSKVEPARNYLNVPLVILAFKEVAASAQYSKVGNETYFIIDVMPLSDYPSSDPEYKPTKLSCGSWKICEQLRNLNAVEDFPLAVTLKADGKSIIMVDA